MVQSVELVVDEHLDALVRAEWQRLVAADLPSQARHTGASNAPHVTVGVASAFTPEAERQLAAGGDAQGLPLRLGGLLVLSGRTHVLARLVVPTAELLALHAGVASAMSDLPDRPDTVAVGRWTPHVTLARRLDDAQLASALHALVGVPREIDGSVAAMRRWDSDARETWVVGH